MVCQQECGLTENAAVCWGCRLQRMQISRIQQRGDESLYQLQHLARALLHRASRSRPPALQHQATLQHQPKITKPSPGVQQLRRGARQGGALAGASMAEALRAGAHKAEPTFLHPTAVDPHPLLVDQMVRNPLWTSMCGKPRHNALGCWSCQTYACTERTERRSTRAIADI